MEQRSIKRIDSVEFLPIIVFSILARNLSAFYERTMQI